jgi:hypothetical protein
VARPDTEPEAASTILSGEFAFEFLELASLSIESFWHYWNYSPAKALTSL